MCLNNIGYLFKLQGKFDVAETLYKQSLAALERAPDPDLRLLASFKSNLADLYLERRNYNDAARLCEDVVALRQQTCGSNHPDIASALADLAKVQTKQALYADAEKNLLRAFAAATNTLASDHPAVLDTEKCLAELYLASNAYAQAGIWLDRIARHLDVIKGRNVADGAEILCLQARLAARQDRNADAVRLFMEALAAYEAASGTAGGETYASHLRSQQREACGEMLDVIATIGRGDSRTVAACGRQAFSLMEAGRPRELVDKILADNARKSLDLPSEDIVREDRLCADMRRVQQLKREAEAAWSHDAGRAAQLEMQLGDLRRQLRALEVEFATNYTRYADLRWPKPIDVGQVQREILVGNEAMLSYWYTESNVFAWIVTTILTIVFVLACMAALSDVAAGKDFAVYPQVRHPGYVTGAVLSPDGNTLVSASIDGTVKFWDMKKCPVYSDTVSKCLAWNRESKTWLLTLMNRARTTWRLRGTMHPP